MNAADCYSTDQQYGNTLVQTGVEANFVWPASKDWHGCKRVQQALDDAATDDERITLASALRTHVLEASRCPNANHVLQKCIEKLRPLDSQFILDEILNVGPNAAASVAKHQFGCRILQRLLEHCPAGQVQGLVDELLRDAVLLAMHRYGNYVLSAVLEHGSALCKLKLTMLLAKDASSIVANKYGYDVLSKALENADPQLQHAGRCLMEQENALRAWRYGRVLHRRACTCMHTGTNFSACK